jgi:hypothetical protein
VTAAPEVGRGSAGHATGRLLAPRRWPSGLADGLGQRDEVVGGGRWGLELALVPDEIPAAGRGEPAGMTLAQIVGMGFGKGGEGTHHRRGVHIDIGQRGYRSLGATVAGAAPG